MITDPDGPADTRIMGIVHSALRRDLLRIEVATSTKTWQETHRVALADHVLWMMDFLHHHHESEDRGLYPRVVQCNPDAAPLVEKMNADHRIIEPAIEAVEDAARDFRADRPGSGEALGAALSRLSEVLLPHLEREEREMMPLVSTSITDAQWRAWDDEFNIKPKGMQQLGKEGNWLIDGLDDPSRDHVVHLVPPVPRFILVHVLGIRHRHDFAALWKGTDAASIPSQPIPKAA
ncbi:hemerythrin domain-containing protein [Rhodococcus rhodochrous]|uniref:hemerythrin domain-containing protein n=1 Tax=Rhodococcus rhodochrous TaxID=1829 RepID=UPI000314835E|nr:hemerythrin domain-containing protein [Rhodococcus rhodochrous]